MKFKSITLNGTRYTENSKCPSCSSEVDKGGRLELKKVKNYFLKCIKCKYTIRSQKVRDKQNKRIAKMKGMSW